MESVALSDAPRIEFAEDFIKQEDFLHESIDGQILVRLPEIDIVLPPQRPSTIRLLEVQGRFFPILIMPESEEMFIARAETESFNATGQGATEEEALADVQAAIELLLEEEANPSEGLPWPEDYR